MISSSGKAYHYNIQLTNIKNNTQNSYFLLFFLTCRSHSFDFTPIDHQTPVMCALLQTMKKLFLIENFAFLSLIVLLSSSCSKSSDDTDNTPTPTNSVGVIYRKAENVNFTMVELWSVQSDGTNNHKLPITLPRGWAFDNYDDVAEVSTDNKTLAMVATNQTSQSAIYKCNIDGTNLQQALIFPANVGIELQGFVDASTVLYLKYNAGADNGLWKSNISGTSNVKINITLPVPNTFGDGKFAKVTSDGKTIMFTTYDSARTSFGAIFKCNIDGSSIGGITSEPTTAISIQSLATDNVILYHKVNQVTSLDELWSVNVDGTNKHQIIPALASGLFLQDEGMAEATSKNVLFFSTTTAGPTATTAGTEAIYTANVDGTGVKKVIDIPSGYAIAIQGLQQ